MTFHCHYHGYSGSVDVLEELAAAANALRRQNLRRADQLRYRDDVIRRALAEGRTWAQIQDAARVGPRIIAIAIKRL